MSGGDSLTLGLGKLLDDGYESGLYSGTAAAVLTPQGRLFASAGTLASDDPTPVGADTLFDLASVTKTFTAATLVRLAEQGLLDLDAPVHAILELGDDARTMTLRHLLLHTSGLPAESSIWRDPTVPQADRLHHLLATPLETPVDAVHRYSCVGYVMAGVVAERITGDAFPKLLRDHVLDPLGLDSVTYGPVEQSCVAATEEQPWVQRGLVHGEVHDELSWYLGGRVGNAGLFAAARDVLGFVESLLDNRLFGEESRRLLTTNLLAPRQVAPYGQAMGARVGDMELSGMPGALGHPGFTGTMWLALPDQGAAAVLLTNRVHPDRRRVDIDPFRRRFSAFVAASSIDS